MKGSIICLLAALTALSEADPAKIIGEISVGKRPSNAEIFFKPAAPEDLDQSSIVNTEGREVTYQKLTEEADPSLLEEKVVIQNAPATVPAPTVEMPQISYSVSARKFSNGMTLVEWWNGPEKNQAWSNIDFRVFEGFHVFEKDEKAFLFQLFCSRGNEEEFAGSSPEGEASSSIPVFEDSIPSYQMVSEITAGSDEEAFINGLHEIFVNRSEDLEDAQTARANLKEQLRLEELEPAPQEKDVTFRYRVIVGPPAE